MNQNRDKQKNRRAFWLAMDFVFQVGLLIVIPLVFFAWLGNMIDDRTDQAPFFFIFGLLVGLLIGGYGTWRKIKEIVQEIEKHY